MTSDMSNEISASLADIVTALERNDGAEAIGKAVREAMLEISTPLADLLAAIERSGPETAKTIANALASMRAEPQRYAPPTIQLQQLPAPEVTVMPAEVVVNVPTTINMPAAEGWRFDVEYHHNGAIKGLTARKLS